MQATHGWNESFGTRNQLIYEQLHLKKDIHLKSANLEDDYGKLSFYTGSGGFDWVTDHEQPVIKEVLKSLRSAQEKVASRKQDSCLMLDVGMNDGYFTNVAAMMNCSVISFEMQQHCIDIAVAALRVNGKSEWVSVVPCPVSSVGNRTLMIPYSDNLPCAGTFGFSRRDRVAHPMNTKKSFTTVALESYLPTSALIDFIKVDVEGHDVEVMLGADLLFHTHRIRSSSVEIDPMMWTEYGQKNGIDAYWNILSYNYTFKCLNPPRLSPQVFRWSGNSTEEAEEKKRFKAAILSRKCVDWNIRGPGQAE